MMLDRERSCQAWLGIGKKGLKKEKDMHHFNGG